tara:strand:+ start:412 stop:531 length:120 start_codon:yes stop_codon:yes gene_type:complete
VNNNSTGHKNVDKNSLGNEKEDEIRLSVNDINIGFTFYF